MSERTDVDRSHVVVIGDVAGSLRRLVAALDAWLDASPLLSHLLWREADTHDAVRDAEEGPPPVAMHRELDFLAEALLLGASAAR